MDTKTIARNFKLLAQLMELHNANPFKTKSYANAAFKLDKLGLDLMNIPANELERIEGIGKGIADKILELRNQGSIKELDDLLQQTPEGVIAMLGIKGLGPKKVEIIWKALEIESVADLYYACNENRLVEAKGFGYKTQEEILKSIEFAMASTGKFKYASVEKMAQDLETLLLQYASKVSITGDMRRKCEIVELIELIVADADKPKLIAALAALNIATQEETNTYWLGQTESAVPIKIYFSTTAQFYWNLYNTTGNDAHVQLAGNTTTQNFASEEAIYQSLGLAYIAPEMREGSTEISRAKSNTLPVLIEVTDLKGILHNHSTYSDGIHSLRDMALYCKELGYAYLGIADHSKTAVYAKGLPIERVLEQHKEIDVLNAELAPFKVFKGIESDILGDGSLDYPAEILQTFDFIVASIHSNLKMDIDKAMNRLLRAIENPYTTILGHPTGRLLLGRAGYPIDHQKMIDACAANGVVIEINANPNRLDLDWRWIDYALSKDVMLSINPDAHKKEGYHDMYYGVCVARKGGLYKEMCFNALSLAEITAHFDKKKGK